MTVTVDRATWLRRAAKAELIAAQSPDHIERDAWLDEAEHCRDMATHSEGSKTNV